MASRILQHLLDTHYPTFAETHPLPAYVRDAVHALRSCRTAALGGNRLEIDVIDRARRERAVRRLRHPGRDLGINHRK